MPPRGTSAGTRPPGANLSGVEPHLAPHAASFPPPFDAVATEYEGLIRAALQLNSTLDLEALAGQILEGACEVLDSEAASLMLVEEPARHLHWFAVLGPAGAVLSHEALRPGEGIAGWVAQTGESVMTDAAATDPRFCARIDALSGFDTRALLCVPMVARGRILGVLEFLNPRDGEPFDARDMRKGQAFASLCTAALENARLFRVAEEVGNVRELARFKADMVTVVAHQMRNPLTSVRGYAEALMLDRELDRSQVELFSRRIHEEAVRLDRMVDDYLRVSRLQNAEISPEEEIDLDERASAAVSRFTSRSRRHRVRLEPDGSLPPRGSEAAGGEGRGSGCRAEPGPGQPESVGPRRALGNGERIDQILDCLLDNAIRYSPDGGEVTVRVLAAGGEWRVTVTDRGLGIPPESIARLYHPFYRVPLPRHQCQTGSGLGLTVARTLVERLGGRLGVESRLGEGSTFWFTLPRAE